MEKDILLKKVGSRTIIFDEVIELSKLMEQDTKMQEMDEGMRTLIMLGLGALGCYLSDKENIKDAMSKMYLR